MRRSYTSRNLPLRYQSRGRALHQKIPRKMIDSWPLLRHILHQRFTLGIQPIRILHRQWNKLPHSPLTIKPLNGAMFRLLVTLQIAQRLDDRPDSPHVARKTAVGVLGRTPGVIAVAFVAAGGTVGVSDSGTEIAEDAFQGSGGGFAEEDIWGFDVSVGDWDPVSLGGLCGVGASVMDAVMAVSYRVDEVVEDIPDEFLVEVDSGLLLTLDEFEEGSFGAVLHVDCSFGVMFLLFDECVVVFDDVGMAQVSKYAGFIMSITVVDCVAV